MLGTCGHCGSEFELSAAQKSGVLRHGWTPYCSQLCKIAAFKAKRKRPIPEPNKKCPVCGEIFTSKTWYDKKYCSLKCYISTPEFKERMKANAAKAAELASIRAGNIPGKVKTICLECGGEIIYKPSQKKKYCNSLCYRRYMAKRFDRFIASPQTIALPQNYDEFLSLDELPCLIEGCSWKGHNLSFHMNMTHGVQARTFKKAAGFNLKSGIISAPLQETLRGWARHGGIVPGYKGTGCMEMPRYRGLEAKEHYTKAMALKLAKSGPLRQCKNCGKVFAQSTPMGETKYCTTDCRQDFYNKENNKRKYPCLCYVCGKKFKGNINQKRRILKGLPVVCSNYCRGYRFGKVARGTWTGRQMEKGL
jgi:hypothetical protein